MARGENCCDLWGICLQVVLGVILMVMVMNERALKYRTRYNKKLSPITELVVYVMFRAYIGGHLGW